MTGGNEGAEMAHYEVRCDGVVEAFEAEDLDEAREWVRDWLRDGAWDATEGTIWPHAYLVDLTTKESERVQIRVDPTEPKCAGSEGHHWKAPFAIVGGIKENPGVRGHGGGVVIQEVCMRCGCGRVTDTWAQNMSTGEQGLESVRYEPGKYIAEIADLSEDA